MADPITWRTITAPSTIGATQALYGAQNAVQNVGKDLSTLVDQANQNALTNQQQAVKNNTQAFYNSLQGATPQQLADPAYQAQVEQSRAAQGNLIDQAATRGYAQTLMEQKQAALEGTQKLADMQQGVSDRPMEQQVAADILAGNTGAATEHAKGLLNASDWNMKIAAGRDKAIGMTQAAQSSVDAHNSSVQGLAASKQAMGFAAQNQVYNQQVQANTLKGINETNTGDALSASASQSLQGAYSDNAAKLAAYAKDNNLTQQADGSLKLTDTVDGKDVPFANDKLQNIANGLKAAGVQSNLSDTTALRQLQADPRFQALSTAGQVRTVAAFNSKQAMDSLSPEDQSRAQVQAERATKPIDQQLEALKRVHDQKTNGNQYLAPPPDAFASMNGIMGDIQKDNFDPIFSNATARSNIIDTGTDLIRNGLTITNDSGQPQNIVVPPSVVKAAMIANRTNWNTSWGEAKNIRASVENYYQTNKGERDAALSAATEQNKYDSTTTDLNTQKIVQQLSVLNAYKKQKNVTFPNTQIDYLLKRAQQ